MDLTWGIYLIPQDPFTVPEPPDYDPIGRHGRQAMAVLAALGAGGTYFTLEEISAKAAAPEASVSARLRDLRKAGHTVHRRRRGTGHLWEYALRT
jgi:hypothetical protein